MFFQKPSKNRTQPIFLWVHLLIRATPGLMFRRHFATQEPIRRAWGGTLTDIPCRQVGNPTRKIVPPGKPDFPAKNLCILPNPRHCRIQECRVYYKVASFEPELETCILRTRLALQSRDFRAGFAKFAQLHSESASTRPKCAVGYFCIVTARGCVCVACFFPNA